MQQKKTGKNPTVLIATSISIFFLMGTFAFPITAIPSQTHYINEKSVTFENEAFNVAQNWIYYHEKQNEFSIQSYEKIIDDKTNQVLFYLYHLNPHGYIAISSNKNIKPVIAYSFSSDAPLTASNNPFYSLLTTDMNLQLDNINQLPQSLRQQHTYEWTLGQQKDYQISQTNFDQWPPEGSTESGGWIETTWHQSSPYNDLCPIDSETDQRGVAGCPAIAMGQILNFHKTINDVQFNDSDDYFHNYLDRFWIDNDYETYDFPSFPQLNQYLSIVTQHFNQQIALDNQDVAALCFACGVAAEQVYSPQASGTFGVDQAFDAYQRFHFNTATLFMGASDELYIKIIDNIKHALPVHFAVVTPSWNAGHNLIIDGYNTDDYYHLNFGWGGSYDGWYHIPSELPYDLTVVEGVIVDINNVTTAEDLNCNGMISLQDVTPQETIYSMVIVENIGITGSTLDWSVESLPSWGQWSITPYSGDGLTPEQGPITLNISLIVPNKKNSEFTGSITIINENNPSDRDYIPISITTPHNKNLRLLSYILYDNHPFFLKILNELCNNGLRH